jgi:glycosyltransferase involved in cell wall biosynthesis
MSSPVAETSLVFSICIPCYNGRKFLRETLESVRTQTYPHWELIFVEDASPEPSKDIIEAFAASVTQSVTYLANSVNAGCAITRERGFKHANHEYLAPLDQDDIWKPNHLAELARTFAESNSEFIFTSFLAFRGDPENVEFDSIPAPELRDQLGLAFFYCRYWLQPSSVAFKRSIFAHVGPWSQGLELKPANLPGNRDSGEDRNFFMRAIFQGITPVWTGCATTYYRQHEASMRGRESHNLAHRAWQHNQLGLLPGFPQAPQRSYLAHANANAARTLAPFSKHRCLAAHFYFKAWQWNPRRIDHLLRAIWSRCQALRHRSSASA